MCVLQLRTSMCHEQGGSVQEASVLRFERDVLKTATAVSLEARMLVNLVDHCSHTKIHTHWSVAGISVVLRWAS